MSAIQRVILVSLISVGFVACGTPGVPWNDYAPAVRTSLERQVAAKDCSGLQTAFDIADATNAATKSRTGHNNAALMVYIDSQMKSVGCYK